MVTHLFPAAFAVLLGLAGMSRGQDSMIQIRAVLHDPGKPDARFYVGKMGEALVRRAGLTLTDEQVATFHGAFGYIETMLETIRKPTRGREAEPALTFDPEGFR